MSIHPETQIADDGVADALKKVVDSEEIRRLKFAYCRAADALDVDGMLAVFTEDCVVDLSGGRGGAVTGLAAARDFYSGALGRFAVSSHHLSNMDVVFESDDVARMESYLYSWQRPKDYPAATDRHRWARYRDEFRRTSDGWRQTRLVCYVAGELTPDAVERFGETTGLPPWP